MDLDLRVYYKIERPVDERITTLESSSIHATSSMFKQDIACRIIYAFANLQIVELGKQRFVFF
jgi:hypothetical protein